MFDDYSAELFPDLELCAYDESSRIVRASILKKPMRREAVVYPGQWSGHMVVVQVTDYVRRLGCSCANILNTNFAFLLEDGRWQYNAAAARSCWTYFKTTGLTFIIGERRDVD